MSSDECSRKPEEFGERIRQLNKDIQFYVQKQLYNLSLWDKMFTNYRTIPAACNVYKCS